MGPALHDPAARAARDRAGRGGRPALAAPRRAGGARMDRGPAPGLVGPAPDPVDPARAVRDPWGP